MTLDELRQYQLKDIANKPLQHQLVLLGLVVVLINALAYYFVFSPKLDELEAARAQEAKLKETFIDKKRQLVNLKALEAQVKEIEKAFGTLIHQLPAKGEIDALLAEINQAGLGRGLQFELFRPSGEIKGPEIAELPIQIRLTGTYEALASFVSDVAQMSRIVTLGDISLSPASGNRMTMDATAKTYRALEAAERLAPQTPVKPK